MSIPKTSQIHLPNLLPSVLRTYVPLLVGYLLSMPLVVRIEDLFGIAQQDRNAWVSRGVTVAITAAYYLLARIIEAYWPQLGSVFVSLGIAKAPTYAPLDQSTGAYNVTSLPGRQEAEAVLAPEDVPDDAPDDATGPNAVMAPDSHVAGH